MSPSIPLVSRLFDRLEVHREKVIDAALLLLAMNVAGLVATMPPPPWPAQLAVLALFVAFAPPRAHLVTELWARYARCLPGYVTAAAAAAGLYLWWFNLPPARAAFAPVWLAGTFLYRLLRSPAAARAADALARRRFDVVAADLGWLAVFTLAVPRWADRPAPVLPAALLAAAWSAWQWFRRGPRLESRDGPGVLLLAAGWGLGWWLSAGAWPALVFTFWLAAALGLTRLLARRAAVGPDGVAEVLRWLGLAAFVALQFRPMASANIRGSDDAHYYATVLADTLTQLRHGVFPVFAGQSEFQFNGSVIPIRIAPGFQYLGGLLDLLTGRTLGFLAVQNLLVSLTGLAGAVAAYACLRRSPAPAAVAWLLALLYVSCPGVLGLAFISDLYMSWLAVPLVPVVLHLSGRSFAVDRPGWYAALGACLGTAWWLHAPIALWLTLVATVLQLVRVSTHPPGWGRFLAQAAAGALAFGLTAAYPVVSAAFHPADPAVGAGGGFAVAAANIAEQLAGAFPGSWLPLSNLGRLLSDFQLGYGLLALGLLAAPAAWRSGRADLRALVVVALVLLLLLLPVPGLNLWMWKLVPAAVRLVTNSWAMQRLYVLIAGCLVLAVAAAWPAARSAPRWRWILAAACCWSTLESIKFVRGSLATIDPHEDIPTLLRPENVTLTRYAYGLFRAKPAYFTHGVTDPALENRLLADDCRTVIGGNPQAVERLARNGPATTHTLTLAAGHLDFQPALTLHPGRHYLAELQASLDPFPRSTLVLKGRTLDRVYGLPDYGEARSFGLGGGHVPWFPVRTTAAQDETVTVRLLPEDAAATGALDGRVRLRLVAYDPAALPILVHDWMPLRAAVQSDTAAWLETPRMYQAGYAASVDGRPAEVRRSVEGLACVRVPAGRCEVELRYVAPAGLRAAFWVSLAALVAGCLAAGAAGARVMAIRAASSSPGAPGR
ncbi:MAG TPA: hypothetical protein VHD61_08800 [Lacunisphaera sp.]|nr:hypothetical protein [Lacunisphaera sp.]